MPPLRYLWTAAEDDLLRRVYADHVQRRKSLSEAITAFARRKGCARHIIKYRAGQLGLTASTQRWTPEDIERLRELAGSAPTKAIAQQLKRGHTAVVGMIDRLKLSRRVRSGYSRQEAAFVLGVSSKSVNKWIEWRWLKLMRGTDRITELSLRNFLGNHPEQYSLKRVDEGWFKGMIFPQ